MEHQQQQNIVKMCLTQKAQNHQCCQLYLLLTALKYNKLCEIWFPILIIGFAFINWKGVFPMHVDCKMSKKNTGFLFQFLQETNFILVFKTMKVGNTENHASLSHYSRGSSFTKQQHKNYTHTNRLLLVHAKVFSWRHTLLYPSFATYLYSKTKTGVTLLRSPHVCIFTTLN